MRRAAAATGFLLLWALLSAPPAPAQVTVRETAELRTLTAPLPGELRAATARDGEWLLLAEGPDGEHTFLLRFVPAEARLEVLRRDLPRDGNALAIHDLDGDGSAELLVGYRGDISSLGPWRRPTAPRTVLAQPGLSLRNLLARDLLGSAAAPDERTLALPSSGHLELRQGGGEPRTVTLPTRVRRTASGLTITSPPVQGLGAFGWVAGPELHGSELHGTTRLRSRLIPRQDGDFLDAWSRFPSPRAVETSTYELLDGQPVLLVSSYRGDKLGIFDQQKVSLFALGEDRTRSGQGPRFEVETKSHRWQPLETRLVDLDGDRRQDLLLFHVKGLDGDELLVDGHPGRGGARFGSRNRRSRLAITPLAWSYGQDFSGDGVADLLVLGTDRIDLYGGRSAGVRGKDLFEPRALASYPLEEALGEVEGTVTVGSEGADGEITSAGAIHPSATGALIELTGSRRLIYLEPRAVR